MNSKIPFGVLISKFGLDSTVIHTQRLLFIKIIMTNRNVCLLLLYFIAFFLITKDARLDFAEGWVVYA